ncbi:MAG: ATP-binding protein, partial [Myxococcota bacterium]
PMNGILGYTDLLLEDDPPTDARTDLRRIREAGEALLTLIDEVLHLARLDAGGPARQMPEAAGPLLRRWIQASQGRLGAAGPPLPTGTTVVIDPGRLDRLVQDLLEGYRQRGASDVELAAKVAGDTLVVAFRPAGSFDPGSEGAPMVWRLAERAGRSAGVTVQLGHDGWIGLSIPLCRRPRGRSPALFAFTPEALPDESATALRVRLSVRLVWFCLCIVGVVGPISLVLQPAGGLAGWLAVTGLVALFGTGLSLYRAARHRLASLVMAFGFVVVVTSIQSLHGGTAGAGMAYFPIVAVLGTLVVGSNGGHMVSVAAACAIVVMGLAEHAGLLPAQPPDPRWYVAFVTAVATTLSAALVAMWSAPVEAALATARDAAWRASEANRATSRFLDAVSIELRTPLNAILGYAELLCEEHEHAAELCGDVGRILEAGRHLGSVVDDLLDMSAIATEQLDLRPAAVELAPLLASALAVIRPLVEGRTNVLEVQVDPDVWGVTADATRLRQILVNLLSNAAKFTERGTIAVQVSAGADMVVIAVQDSGIGIARQDLKRLFEPFRQVHRGRPGEYGGTGLGLAISRQLARKMGGDIRVRSSLGNGSRFSLFLPRATADQRSRGSTMPSSRRSVRQS